MLRKNRKLSFEGFEGRLLLAAVAVAPIVIEAESMQVSSGNWKLVSDSGASGKKSLAPTKDNVGELTKTFTVAEAGTYSFTEFFKAPDLQANSFAYQIDGGPVREVSLPKTSGYKSQVEAPRETLAAGPHSLKVLARENGTRLDKFVFTREGGGGTNQAPVANAGPDQTKTGTLNAALAGSVSDDGLPTGGTFSSVWSKISGPGSVGFANAAAPTTTVTFGAYGVYVLRLSAADGELTGFDDVTITLSGTTTGNVIRITGTRTSQVRVDNPPNGATIDLAGANIIGGQNNYGDNTDWPDPVAFGHKSDVDHSVWPLVDNVYSFTVKGTGSNYTVRGGVIYTVFDTDAPWHIWKGLADGDGVRYEGTGQNVLDSVRVHNTEDGFSPHNADGKDGVAASAGNVFTVSNSYFSHIQDDVIENDGIRNMVIRDSFLQGHTMYSADAGGNANVLFDHVVGELELLHHEGRISGATKELKINEEGGYPFPDGLGVGCLFKLGSPGKTHVKDSVFLVPRASTSSMSAMDLGANNGVTYSNVTIVWLGEGSYPGVIPPGVTITRDRTKFDQAKDAFFASHPQFTEGELVNRTAPLP